MKVGTSNLRFESPMSGTLSFDLSLEYYGTLGPLGDLLPGHEQIHQFYPGADIRLSDNAVWNVGVGIAATETGNQLVYRTRIGILFGGKHH